ncbi:hypothetical protein ACT7DH_06760 [Bacillus pacificus]
MITIPIISRIYEEDGEILNLSVAGEKDVPLENVREYGKRRTSKEMRLFILIIFKRISFSGLTII